MGDDLPPAKRTERSARSNRTPRHRPALTRALVLERAMLLADGGGIDALSMRTLARALGVEAMSLYHHVRDKDDLLDGLIDVVFGEIWLPPAELPWRDALGKRARSTREVLLRHRWAVALMDSRANLGPATLQQHDRMIGILRAEGFTMRRIGQIAATMDAFVFGFVLQERSLPGAEPAEIEAMTNAMLDYLPVNQSPNRRDFAVELVLQPGFDVGGQFEWGLELLLGGIETGAR